MQLRPVTDADAADVLRLNEAEVEKLAPMDADRMAELRASADRFDVIEVEGRFGGFVVTFGPDAAYDSPNYRWFAARHGAAFAYLDRIVLDPGVRRRGVASAVYDEVEADAARLGRLALEVNLVPPNPASLAFHRARGYAEVGRLGDEDGKVVSLMEKPL